MKRLLPIILLTACGASTYSDIRKEGDNIIISSYGKAKESHLSSMRMCREAAKTGALSKYPKLFPTEIKITVEEGRRSIKTSFSGNISGLSPVSCQFTDDETECVCDFSAGRRNTVHGWWDEPPAEEGFINAVSAYVETEGKVKRGSSDLQRRELCLASARDNAIIDLTYLNRSIPESDAVSINIDGMMIRNTGCRPLKDDWSHCECGIKFYAPSLKNKFQPGS